MPPEAKTMTLSTLDAIIPAERRQLFEESYARHKDAIAAVREDDLEVINLDLFEMITTITGAYPKIISLRLQLAALPDFRIEDVDALEGLAFALGLIQTKHMAAVAPPAPIGALATQVGAKRDILVHGIEALQQRKLLSAEALEGFIGGSSYKAAAFDTVAAANVLRGVSQATLARSGVTLEEIDEATSLAGELTAQLGQREQAPEVVGEIALERQQGFTLTLRAYDEALRGVTFLRWRHGDVDDFAPSLYAGRRRRGQTVAAGSEIVKPTPAPLPAPGGTTPPVPALDPRSPGMDPFRT